MSSSRFELTDGKPRRIRDVLGSFSFAYLLCICLVAIPIASAGLYSILAFTRLLNPLMNAGVVKYHDLNLGFMEGVENLKYYLYAKQPVDWRLVGFCALLYLGFYLLKAVQFHSIARFYKLKGSFGNHTRALYYGVG